MRKIIISLTTAFPSVGLRAIKISLNSFFCFLSVVVLQVPLSASGPVVGVRGQDVLVDGSPVRLWGVRVASATQSEVLTEQLIANLDDYRAHGVNAITVFYQGSSGGYSDPFSPDGMSIDPSHQARMERIVAACAERGMIVIVGIFYQRSDQPRLQDWEAVREAVRTVARALQPHRNVIINLANEQSSARYDGLPWRRVRVPGDLLALARLVRQEDPDRLIGAGGYEFGHNVTLALADEIDLLLYDQNGPEPTPAALAQRFREAGITKPIVNVELFGAWTRESRPAGVYTEATKAEYYRAIDEAILTPGHGIFFHSSPWLQATTEPEAQIRFDLGGKGTADDPGIRWYFEYLRDRLCAQVIFYEDFENEISMGREGSGHDLVRAPVRAGQQAYKATLEEGKDRTELKIDMCNDCIRWAGVSIYIPSDASRQWTSLVQYHLKPGSVGWHAPSFQLTMHDDKLSIRTYSRNGPLPSRTIGDVRYDTWEDFVFCGKYSTGDDGYLRVWRNGEKVYDESGRTVQPGRGDWFFKMGVYIGVGNESDKTYSVFFDEVRIGDETSSLEDVSPRGQSHNAMDKR